jgi:hypothetical protein
MTDLVEVIRNAIARDASPEARAAGAQACRAILSALDATPGEPRPAAIASPPPVATIAAALRGLPADQLLDVAIAKLQSMLPADTKLSPVTPLRFDFIRTLPRG